MEWDFETDTIWSEKLTVVLLRYYYTKVIQATVKKAAIDRHPDLLPQKMAKYNAKLFRAP
jgi:hypothetical protein